MPPALPVYLRTRRSSHFHADLLKAREQSGSKQHRKGIALRRQWEQYRESRGEERRGMGEFKRKRKLEEDKREHERLPCSLNLAGMWSLCTRSFPLLLALWIRPGRTRKLCRRNGTGAGGRRRAVGMREREKQNDCVIAPLYVTRALHRHFSTGRRSRHSHE